MDIPNTELLLPNPFCTSDPGDTGTEIHDFVIDNSDLPAGTTMELENGTMQYCPYPPRTLP